MKAHTSSAKLALDLAQWHRARIEVIGDEMLFSLDGKPTAYLKSEGVAHPTKNVIGFTIGGQVVHFRDVRLAEATLAPQWEARRAEVLATLPKAP